MKKNILIIVAGFMINACIGYGVPIPLVIHLSIGIEDIKDIRVKTIKITLKNLDGIQPQYEVLGEINGIPRPLIIKRKRSIGSDGKEYYFPFPDDGDGSIDFIIDKGAKNLDKKRTYELKMYVNDKLFFRKILSFTITRIDDFFDAEFDNMEYVTKGGVIKITDADIKRWFQKKP